MNNNGPVNGVPRNELRYLTDEMLCQGIEAMFFAYRGFTFDPDEILAQYGYGRAHHRAIHFIRYRPGINVSKLIAILGISKQSLNRVLRRLINDKMVKIEVNTKDRRCRELYLSSDGMNLARELFEVQRKRMRAAYRKSGPEAVTGFRTVLENIMDREYRTGARTDVKPHN